MDAVLQEEAEAMVAECLISMANSDDERSPQGNDGIREMEISLTESEIDKPKDDGTWECHKCKKHNGGHRKRCQGCLGWRGGVRENISRLKKSSEDSTNVQIEKEEEYSFDQNGAVLPSSNEWEHEKYSTAQCDMVWDSTLAGNASTEVSLLESIVPHDRKESALRLLHENKYQINGILDKVMKEEPCHGMHWSPATKKIFSSSMDREKDFKTVAKRMSKSTGDCQAYYYSSFKGTKDYTRLKHAQKEKVRVKTRSTSGGSVASEQCTKCKGSGELLRCDMCTNMFHLRCAMPPLDVVPLGTWFCEDCDPKE